MLRNTQTSEGQGPSTTRPADQHQRGVGARLRSKSHHNRSYDDIAASIGIPTVVLRRRVNEFWRAIADNNRQASSAPTPRRTRTPSPFCKSYNAARARHAASTDADKIATLGDLTQYGLPTVLRESAELRRAHPELSLSELGARLGVTKDVYAGRMRRFWTAVRKQTDQARRRRTR